MFLSDKHEFTVGFFGAYTTFSTCELEAETLLIHRNQPITLLFWVGTALFGVLFGVLCLEAGSYFARQLQ